MLKKLTAIILTAAMAILALPTGVLAVERYEVLRIGDKDEYVLKFQQELSDKGYFDTKPTGYFGTVTQAAVIAFQKDAGLVSDGKAGPDTRKALLGDKYYPLPANRVTGDSASPGKPENGGAAGTEKLRAGDRGEAVSRLQRELERLEYYTYGSITGYFGPVTTEALKRFQRVNGLKADGIAGEKTLGKLYSAEAKYYVIYPGDRGEDVRALQNRLRELQYFSGSATGYFGTVTSAAVKSFQAANGIYADGLVGRDTRRALNSSDAVISPDNPATGDPGAQTPNAQKIEAMLSFAKTKLGSRYVWSDEGPNTFDCSGFVYYVLRNSGVNISRMTAASYSQYAGFTKVAKKSSLKAGDLVFFKSDSSSRVNHTGIYLGDNQFIHASSSAGKVVISNMTSYYERNFVCGRRVFG